MSDGQCCGNCKLFALFEGNDTVGYCKWVAEYRRSGGGLPITFRWYEREITEKLIVCTSNDGDESGPCQTWQKREG